jgi:hypothetical protein
MNFPVPSQRIYIYILLGNMLRAKAMYHGGDTRENILQVMEAI